MARSTACSNVPRVCATIYAYIVGIARRQSTSFICCPCRARERPLPWWRPRQSRRLRSDAAARRGERAMKTVWPGRSVTDPRAATRLATAADDFQPVAPTHPYLRCRPVAATVIVVIRERHDANVQSVQQVDAADGPEWPLQHHAFVENSIQEVDQRIQSQGEGHNVRILSLAKRSPKSPLRWA